MHVISNQKFRCPLSVGNGDESHGIHDSRSYIIIITSLASPNFRDVRVTEKFLDRATIRSFQLYQRELTFTNAMLMLSSSGDVFEKGRHYVNRS